MVLCKYFQQGNCRFGTKCTNEHFDVKQIIKTDVESAINGNQWPLSCFGPFKDKPCIPNFIEDQSFEEIRFLCYESRQKNFFEQFHLQFSKEVLEAKNKLKSLLQLTPEVVELVSKLYDAPVDATVNGNAVLGANTNNPFGLMGDNSAAGGGNSIFGKQGLAPSSAGNVFGGGSTFGPPAASNTGGLFGNSSGGTTTGGGIFGAALNTTFNSVPTQQTSIFGQVAKPTNSIFGGGTQQTSIFGQTATPSGGLFGQAANTQQQQAAAGGAGLFAQAAQQQQQQKQPGLGLFAQAAQQTAPVFGQQQQSGIFSQPTQALGGNLFMQPQQQQQQQQQQHQLQSQANVAGAGLFAAAAAQTQNFFVQQPQQQQPQQQQQQSTNIFAQAAQQTQLQTSQPATATSGLFQQSGFMQPNQAPTATSAAGVNVSSTAYSRMEDLTAEEIEAFKADRFTMGNIPFSPPPKETVN